MELAVSNIAWSNEEEAAVADKLKELGVRHVEIAPTKIWQDPTVVTIERAEEYVNWWADRGISVSAFQSMLFLRPDLKIFESAENREQCQEHLKKYLELAGVMKASKLVFGSPKNRQRGEMPIEQASRIAYDFFSNLGEAALKNNVILCVEPNAQQYNCDFITNAKEGIDLVRGVNNEGFRLHLDTACMTLAGDDVATSIIESRDILEHFHISSPMLDQVEYREDVRHKLAARTLKEINYNKLISIEMRPGDIGTNVERVEKAVKFAQKTYLNY